MNQEEKRIIQKEYCPKHITTKGITLISLIVTIIVIIIIAGVTVYSGVDSIRNSKVTKFNTELKVIHARVNAIAEENQSAEELNKLGQTISTLDASVQSKITTAMQGESIDGFRYFNKKNLEDIGISGIKREVVINFATREVVDINGVKKDGMYIYRVEGWNNIQYENRNTEAPEFSISKRVYGLNATIKIENIVYEGNVNKGTISYCLYNNSTEGTWKNVVGEEFSVDQSGIYKVRLTDGAGNVTDKTVEVVLTNKPKLDGEMVPVVYDADIGKWKTVPEDSGLWYDYASDKKQWANVMLQDGLTINSDGTIDNDKMGSMFVWIPRYMYQIESGYHPATSTEVPIEGSINIKFLKGTTSLASDGSNVKISTTSGQGNWLVHPAFTANTAMGGGDKEVTGFWVAKFEASSDTTTASNPNTGTNYGRTDNETDNVRVVPNVTSWRHIDVISIYKVCKKMNQSGNTYGITITSNPHMMKNSEWGAVAYLAQSDYGNKQINADSDSGVWSNSYHNGDGNWTTRTGMVGAGRDTGTANGSASTTYYEYHTENGQKGSTTRTIYGIYDMAGGSWEFVAGYIAGGSNTYAKYFKKLSASEKQEYAGTSSTRTENYQANSDKYGDAVWETSREDAGNSTNLSWNRDFAFYPIASYPFILRGGACDTNVSAGMFCFSGDYGQHYYVYGFRPVIGV